MPNEIERKFFIKHLPDLSGIRPKHYERYFLERLNGVEVRISKVDDSYTYEKKIEVSNLERSREKKDITKEEFENLKNEASEVIVRERYNMSAKPNITIQIYHGRFEGLVRAEVEFETEEEARSFVPLEWMGKEMTGLPIARDSRLLDLTDEELKAFIDT